MIMNILICYLATAVLFSGVFVWLAKGSILMQTASWTQRAIVTAVVGLGWLPITIYLYSGYRAG